MLRAEARGRSIVPHLHAAPHRLARHRLRAHVAALVQATFSSPYALLGFILILFRKRTDRTLLDLERVPARALSRCCWRTVPMIHELPSGSPFPQPDTGRDRAAQCRHAVRSSKASDYPAHRAAESPPGGEVLSRQARPSSFFFILGLFILGLYVGTSRRMFENVAAHRALFRRLIVTGAIPSRPHHRARVWSGCSSPSRPRR